MTMLKNTILAALTLGILASYSINTDAQDNTLVVESNLEKVDVVADEDLIEQADAFQVKALGVQEELILVRYMPQNGLTWVLQDMSWVSVSEAKDAPLFEGNYQVQMVETEGAVWYVRSDGLTGRTWVLGEDEESKKPVWIYATDPELDADIASVVE